MAKGPKGIAVEDDLHKKVKAAASLRDMNLEQAYDAALRLWLGEAEPAPGLSPLNAKHRLMLEEILTNADPRVIALVKSVLEIHAAGLTRRKQ